MKYVAGISTDVEEALSEAFEEAEKKLADTQYSFERIVPLLDQLLSLVRADLKESMRTIAGRVWQQGYEQGREERSEKDYFEGLRDGLIDKKLCQRCLQNPAQSIHHLIPRSLGGRDTIENLVALCNKCHDRVEIETSVLLAKNTHTAPRELELMLIEGWKA